MMATQTSLRATTANDAEFVYWITEITMKTFALKTWVTWMQSEARAAIAREVVEAKAVLMSFPIKLRVLRVNPACTFYQKQDFRLVSETKEHFFMESV